MNDWRWFLMMSTVGVLAFGIALIAENEVMSLIATLLFVVAILPGAVSLIERLIDMLSFKRNK